MEDLVSGDALFQELRQFFDEAARNPVNKSAPSEISAHWQVVYSVCKATFASQNLEDLWLHTSQILDSLLWEIKARPAILVHQASSAQVLLVATSSPGTSHKDPQQPAALLAPWLLVHLLRTLATLKSQASSRISLPDQEQTLCRIHEAIVQLLTSLSAHFCLEDCNALDIVQSLVDALFALAQKLDSAQTNVEFDVADVLSDSNPSVPIKLSLSSAEAKALEPALLLILSDIVTTGVAPAQAPEMANLLQSYTSRNVRKLAKGKAKEAHHIADLGTCLIVAQKISRACSDFPSEVPASCMTSCCLVFVCALEEYTELATVEFEAVAPLERSLAALIKILHNCNVWSFSWSEHIAKSLQNLLSYASSGQTSPDQQRMLSDLIQLDLPFLAFLQQVQSGESTLTIDQIQDAASKTTSMDPDFKKSLELLVQQHHLLWDHVWSHGDIQPKMSQNYHKREQSNAEMANGTRTTAWRSQVQALLSPFERDVPWGHNESLDTMLVRLVQRIPSILDPDLRRGLIKTLGWIACARDGTLQRSQGDMPIQPFCPHCDDDTFSEVTAKPDRSLRGVAMAALLQMQKSTGFCRNSPEDQLAVCRSLSRMLQHSKPSAHVIDPETDTARALANLLDHEDRLIRISIGRALAVMQQVLSQESCDPAASKSNLNMVALRKLEACLGKSKALRETSLITLGRLGRWASDEQLPNILQLLISLLGRQGDPVASVAYVQIVSLAKNRGSSPYKLFAPFLPALSPFIIQQNSSSLLDAFSELIGVSRTVFLKQNVSYIVPALILQGRRQSIEHLAAACEMTVPELIAHNAARIISTLQLSNFEVCKSGTQFMLGLFAHPQTLKGIFQSCAAEVLFELVVEWGDSTARSDLALGALEKFVKQRVTDAKTVDSLLGSQLLGILALMNDFLNDLHGRRSVAQKRKALAGLGRLISRVGVAISDVTPQVMATLQSSLAVPPLRLPTLEAWHAFITSLKFEDIGPFVSQTSAALVRVYPQLQADEQAVCRSILDFLVRHGKSLGPFADEIADLSSIPSLSSLSSTFRKMQASNTIEHTLASISLRIDSDNESVCLRGLCDLKLILERDTRSMRELGAGDTFDPILGKITKSVINSAIRSGDAWPEVRDMAFDCLGALGALDPDRVELPADSATFVLQNNFADKIEAAEFAVDFIQHVLVRAYQASNDTKHQAALAYSIQQLLKFCEFGPALLTSDANKMASIPLQILNRWRSLPKPVIETIAPLLTSRFEVKLSTSSGLLSYPLYQHKTAYRDWLREWTLDMIGMVTDSKAKAIFTAFLSVVKIGDVGVARRLVPHLVLHLVLSEKENGKIKTEILEVLEDQTRSVPHLPSESRLLSAQVIFDTMDHLGQWMRRKTAEVAKRRAKYRKNPEAAAAVVEKGRAAVKPVKRLLASIPQELQAEAAQKCKSHARALLNFERRLTEMRKDPSTCSKGVNEQLERLHEIYAEIEEPDGMEGISTQIIDPSTMHRIREHESTGRWTSAQSCWEVELQNDPDNLDYHTGLLKCLRNLGHYDSLRTHIVGVLHSHPEWRSALAPFELEGSLILGDWNNVSEVLQVADTRDPASVFASVTLSLQMSGSASTEAIFKYAREQLGSEIVGAGQESYRRVYDAVTNLHILHELELIHRQSRSMDAASETNLEARLGARLDALSPAFRIKEQVLSMRRTAFRLLREHDPRIGQLWLETAKVARKANHPQTSYSATLQAERAKNVRSFLQRVKLEKTVGLATRALQELDRELLPLVNSAPQNDRDDFLAKGALTRARWMMEADRYESNDIIKAFTVASQFNTEWESPWYYLAQYYQELLRRKNPDGSVDDYDTQARQYQFHTVKCLISCLTLGSKYIYQAMPRWLTIFMDFGMHKELLRAMRAKRKSDTRTSLLSNDAQGVTHDFKKLAAMATKAVERFPSWHWITVFPQVVSRICHANEDVYRFLDSVMVRILREFPHHAVWQMGAVVHSTMSRRAKRCTAIFDKAKSGALKDVVKVIAAGEIMVKQLLNLANYKVRDGQELRMSTNFPGLFNLAPSPLIVPLQSSLTVTLPSAVVNQYEHKPFPIELPIIARFDEQIDVMSSLAKPRKIVIYDHTGTQYSFLCKPHDDLRKDARLMEFNSMINKLLKKDSESRRRHLVIRTYCVLPLNEECGLIEWVPNTVAFRSIMSRLWEARGVQLWSSEVRAAYDTLRKPSKDPNDTIGRRFQERILAKFPPVFHEWFIETFPEPSTWLKNRMAYARTAAVMSMIGFVLGLGDRHGENILFDSTTGETVHVDFNCLFDKGRTFEIMEKVPFRLTQNMVDGFGITGVEGAFRRSCEISMRVLRASQDSLMSVLEAFVHDPLVEWGNKKKKGSNSSTDEAATDEARKALIPIRRKLQGFQSSSDPNNILTYATTTENQVQNLIQEATSAENLGSMYIGWAAFM